MTLNSMLQLLGPTEFVREWFETGVYELNLFLEKKASTRKVLLVKKAVKTEPTQFSVIFPEIEGENSLKIIII